MESTTIKMFACKGRICISLLFDRDIQNEISCVHKKYSAISSTFLSVFLLFSRKRIGLSPLVGTRPLPHSVATYGLPGGYAHYGAVLPAWDIPCVRANTKGFDLNLQIGKKDYWSVESQSGQL